MTGPAPVDPPAEGGPAPVPGRRAVARGGPIAGGMAARLALTIIGAVGLIVGAFLSWLKRGSVGSLGQKAKETIIATGVRGTKLSGKSYFSTRIHAGQFIKSAGLPMIVLGLIAVFGLTARSGWLTRLAGALGIVAFVLFAIEVVRAPQFKISNIGIGAWMCLAGAVIALIGGFFGTRPVVDEQLYGPP
jgi:hypothetical protein